MLVGYARVSTDDQDFALQEDALKGAGFEKIFYDKINGSGLERVGLRDAIDYLRDGKIRWSGPRGKKGGSRTWHTRERSVVRNCRMHL